MILNYNKNECCGCTACYNICPKSAISMEEDTEGFLIPIIDQNLCVECGKCRSVCGFKQKNINTLFRSVQKQRAYGNNKKCVFRSRCHMPGM